MFQFLRNFCPLIFAATIVAITGCDPLDYQVGQPSAPHNGQTQPTNFEGPGPAFPTAEPRIIIGSFNIQILGKTKMSKPHVVQKLIDVARRFDVLAIQELKDIDNEVIWEFLNLLNQDGSTYEASVGPRDGYRQNGVVSSNAEQAVFLFDRSKVEMIGQPYLALEHYQRMHRSPYVGHFRCLGFPAGQGFSFVLLNVHVDPDDTQAEFVAMQDIIHSVYANHAGEDDFIYVGDFNEAPDKFAGHWMQQQFAAIPSTWSTNTRQDANYDNIVFDANYTEEFTGESGVFDLMAEYGLSYEQATQISDHMPVWAVFSAREAPLTSLTQRDAGTTVR